MTGRPSDFTQEIADEICERLVAGESLRAICAGDHMPHVSTVCRWLARDDAFREQYAHARDAQADTLADETLQIADRADLDPQDRRVRIDTRKWLAGKLKPKRYGEKVVNEHTGADGGALTVAVKFV